MKHIPTSKRMQGSVAQLQKQVKDLQAEKQELEDSVHTARTDEGHAQEELHKAKQELEAERTSFQSAKTKLARHQESLQVGSLTVTSVGQHVRLKQLPPCPESTDMADFGAQEVLRCAGPHGKSASCRSTGRRAASRNAATEDRCRKRKRCPAYCTIQPRRYRGDRHHDCLSLWISELTVQGCMFGNRFTLISPAHLHVQEESCVSWLHCP